jgi:hypothetical protein
MRNKMSGCSTTCHVRLYTTPARSHTVNVKASHVKARLGTKRRLSCVLNMIYDFWWIVSFMLLLCCISVRVTSLIACTADQTGFSADASSTSIKSGFRLISDPLSGFAQEWEIQVFFGGITLTPLASLYERGSVLCFSRKTLSKAAPISFSQVAIFSSDQSSGGLYRSLLSPPVV